MASSSFVTILFVAVMIAKGQDPIVEHDIGVVNDAMPGGKQVLNASLVHQLLQDLGTAALRPLYSEVALPSSWRSRAVDPPSASIKNTSCENVLQRTWIEVNMVLIFCRLICGPNSFLST